MPSRNANAPERGSAGSGSAAGWPVRLISVFVSKRDWSTRSGRTIASRSAPPRYRRSGERPPPARPSSVLPAPGPASEPRVGRPRRRAPAGAARRPSPPGRGGGRAGLRQLVAEDRPGPASRTPDGATEARAHFLHQGVPYGGGDAGQGGESGDGARLKLWVWPDVPAAASARKLAMWAGPPAGTTCPPGPRTLPTAPGWKRRGS
jgi:hypothetical protein